MPGGVYRPVTLTDVLGQMAGATEGNTDTSVSGVGQVAEASEQMAMADSVSTTVQAATNWSEGQWGTGTWQ